MLKLRTHYDNLKVSRDAPIEVIQAAYRSLARKYHPDTNAGNPETGAIMRIINGSYEVLSDPVRRAEHDRWIAGQEGRKRALRTSDRGTTNGSSSSRQAEERASTNPTPWTILNVLMTIAYFASALSMLRAPGFRLIGIGMLLVGWFYLKSWRR